MCYAEFMVYNHTVIALKRVIKLTVNMFVSLLKITMVIASMYFLQSLCVDHAASGEVVA